LPILTYDQDVRRGEYITGFIVRSGFWIDGIQILTSLGRKSRFFGNAHGGDPYVVPFPCIPQVILGKPY
jgi:hypothetical protein